MLLSLGQYLLIFRHLNKYAYGALRHYFYQLTCD
jgi:hypothetical protein